MFEEKMTLSIQEVNKQIESLKSIKKQLMNDSKKTHRQKILSLDWLFNFNGQFCNEPYLDAEAKCSIFIDKIFDIEFQKEINEDVTIFVEDSGVFFDFKSYSATADFIKKYKLDIANIDCNMKYIIEAIEDIKSKK